ncbi:MAG: phosphatase PAP2 family protein [Melioribacter sp.]|nr:phosphatase PAP2 family protein [Melioribacter sp.]
MLKNIFTQILISYLIAISINTNTFSQSNYNFYQFKEETIKYFKRPLEWDSEDWIKLSAISLGTILAFNIDQTIRDECLKNRSYYKSFPIEAGRKWGEIYTTVIFGTTVGLHSILTKDKSTKRIAYEIFQSAFYSGLITQVIKISFGRARPFTNYGSNFYKPFTLFNDDFHSLPSGHVTLAFSLSTILAKNSDSDVLKTIYYMPALLTAISRVYQDNHWTSDVILGATIGYFVGVWVHKIHDETNLQTPNLSLINTGNYKSINIRIIF